MDNQNSFGPRPMVQGDWTCSECNKEIKELPFKPDGSRPLFCIDCHRAKNQNSFGPRPMVQGDWTCSECNKEIKELPFKPREEASISCKECYMAKRQR